MAVSRRRDLVSWEPDRRHVVAYRRFLPLMSLLQEGRRLDHWSAIAEAGGPAELSTRAFDRAAPF